MVTSTFAHPYIAQVVALWLSFLPVAAIGGLMVGSLLRGDRGKVRIERVRVPVHASAK
jgi:hypothetical protein